MPMTTQELAASIQKGIFKPHIYLTNVCLSYFQNMGGFVARKVFPIVHVLGPLLRVRQGRPGAG